MTTNEAAPAQDRLYKLSPTTWDIPQGVTDQARHVVAWVDDLMSWPMADVRIKWFEEAGPLDWEGDAGVFPASHPVRAGVHPDDPRTIRLHRKLIDDPRSRFVRSVLHEACHVHQLAIGLYDRLTNEQMEEEVEALLKIYQPVLGLVSHDRMY